MSPPHCLVCGHVNPAGAKFCTECGSPQIKRCGRCSAFNDPTAKNCSKCNVELTEPMDAHATPTFPRQNAASRVQAFSAEGPSLLFDFTDDVPFASSGVKVNPAAAPSGAAGPEPATTRSVASRLARPAGTIEHAQAEHAPATRSLGMSLPVVDQVAQAATTNVQLQYPEAMTEQRAKSRTTPVVSLSLLAFVVIGIFAYKLYSPSVPPQSKHDSAGVGASSGASPSLATKEATPIETPGSATSNESPTATASVGATSDRVRPTQQIDAKTEDLVKKPSSASPDASGLRNKTTPVTDNEVNAKQSAIDRPVRRYPAASAMGSVQSRPVDGDADVRSDSPRQCTKQVAALGLCGLDQIEEQK